MALEELMVARAARTVVRAELTMARAERMVVRAELMMARAEQKLELALRSQVRESGRLVREVREDVPDARRAPSVRAEYSRPSRGFAYATLKSVFRAGDTSSRRAAACRADAIPFPRR